MTPPQRDQSRSALPDVVGLCPVHGGEFYVPHEGTCPQYGCDEPLVIYELRATPAAGLEECA